MLLFGTNRQTIIILSTCHKAVTDESSTASDPANVRRELDRHVQASAANLFRGYEPCGQDLTTNYLNTIEVKNAIHVDAGIEWNMCAISREFNYDSGG